MHIPEQFSLPFPESQCDYVRPTSTFDATKVEALVTPPTLAASSQRSLGAYYTPSIATELLATWALRNRGDRVLEPSMGDGAFLAALSFENARRHLEAEIWGVELAADTFEATVQQGLVDPARALRNDFLAVTPFEVDAVVGNPPYVRLRNLPQDEALRARRVASETLAEPMDPGGSLWMPFVLHATRFLSRSGRLALVLPFDLTYVRYARPLWHFLGRNFGSLRVVRVHERMFPEILQEVVLLFADDFGKQTEHVSFQAFRSLSSLTTKPADVSINLPISKVLRGDRVFLEALIPSAARELLNERLASHIVPAREIVRFNIGYVCGDKRFFHPGERTIATFGITESSLRPAITSSRQLRGVGLMTSSLPLTRRDQLFLPPSDESRLTAGERRYIAFGEKDVSKRYKCQIRAPWYVTPGVKVPDVVVPVFTERPTLLVNDAGVVASNSLLCGYLQSGSAEALACSWYTTLTLLQLELEVHSLGGGVMVLVPREAGSIRLPPLRGSLGDGHLKRINDAMTREGAESAFSLGDGPVLGGVLGLSPAEVDLLRAAVVELTYWRTALRQNPGDLAA